MKKSERQDLIKKLIRDNQLTKQEEFVELLLADGIEVTQATISRDIKELKLIKVSQPDGSFYYSLSSSQDTADEQRLERMLQSVVLKFAKMEKLFTLKTLPGNAVPLGMLLEKVYQQELFTVMTTDDKVLLIFKEEMDASVVEMKINVLIYG